MQKDILTSINQARYISCLCRERAGKLSEKLSKLNRSRSSNIDVVLRNMNKKDVLKMQIDRLNDRADKVWGAVTDFQGKYINWKNLHEVEGKTYSGIIELITASYQHSSAIKYSL